MKVGIVANEFFDQSLGRMGGFGWVAWAAARALREVGGMEAVFLTSELRVPGGETTTNGVRLLTSTGSRTEYARRLARERFDLLLTVDWRNNYRGITLALPRTPLLVWVQDPRTAFDVRRVDSLIAPGVDVKPKGIDALDCTGLRHVERASRVARRPFLLAGHARYLEEKVEGTYGLHPDRYEFLPDPVRLPSVVREESPEPTVLFLGRTDPIKRPWLFFELARRMPDVRFSLLGQAHFTGAGAWVPDEVPANLELAGHVGEEVKNDYLRRAWALVNPSIHEALPISFLEALACEVPIVSMQNPDELASRYGEYVGRWEGDGMAGAGLLEAALRRLLDDPVARRERGRAGQAWVRSTHTEARFVETLGELAMAHLVPDRRPPVLQTLASMLPLTRR